MAISKENFIVVYRLGDEESREFAEYYADAHNMDYGNPSICPLINDPSAYPFVIDGQLVGVPCSLIEVLEDENSFNNEVLIPLQGALNHTALRDNKTIWGIVLGYNVPGGFYYNEDPSDPLLETHIVSSVSRVSRGCAKRNNTYHNINYNMKSKLYNRSIFKRFDAEDAEQCLVVSRIDSPTLALCKEIVDRGIILNKQLSIDGTFYIDPYSDKIGEDADNYEQNILDFSSNIIPRLGSSPWVTTFIDPYIDVTLPFAKDDSFVWSWFTDRSSSTFFYDTNSIRTFLYNADNDGAKTIRDADGITWPILALNAGYALTAGSMSDPTIEGFLNSNPFFISLLKRATSGESYLYGLPYYDSPLTLFGDPLSVVAFPNVDTEIPEDQIEESESWRLMSQDLSRTASHLYKKQTEAQEVLDKVINSNDANFEIDLLYKANSLYQDNNETSRLSQLKELTERFFQYPEKRYEHFGLDEQSPTIDNYLTGEGFKVSRLLTEVSGSGIISSDNLLDEGFWEFEFQVQDDSFDAVNYHFVLNVYIYPFLSHEYLVVSTDSFDLINWQYEIERDNFVDMIEDGVHSGLIGRRVRYNSRFNSELEINEYLTRGETYYFVVTQYTRDTIPSTYFETREYTDIIYT